MPVRNAELVGTTTMELFDVLQDDSDVDEGWEDCEVKSVIVVVELESDTGKTGIAYQCSDTRAWFQTALLEAAVRASLDD